MNFDEWLREKLSSEKGLFGRIVYQEDEDSYVLDTGGLFVGIGNPLWENFEDKKISVKIEVLEDKQILKVK